jgi:hypothetical protein
VLIQALNSNERHGALLHSALLLLIMILCKRNFDFRSTHGNMASDTKLSEISSFRRILPQVLASTAKNLLLLDLGMAVSFPTIVIPALRGLKEHDNDDILSFTAGVMSINFNHQWS